MDIESKLKNKSILDIEVSFDDLVENYAPQLISAIKRYLSVLDELPKIANHIDEVISTIRNSNTPEEAKVKLIKLLGISSYTAKCVLNMPLGKLTGLRKEDLIEEKSQLLSSLKKLIK